MAGTPPVVLQSRSVTARLVDGAAEIAGLALLAAGLAAGVALVYRWYTRERVPGGLPVLVGLSGVVVAIGATGVLRQVIGDVNGTIDEARALLNVVTMLTSAVGARAGTDVGDRVGSDLFVATGTKTVGTEVGRVVQAVGRVITVELPEDVEDIVGYDPVPAETKAALAGKTFVFPRRLTVAELRDRLVTRLKADYAVGHVDLELADDGSVEYLAVGSRAAGIGPTLPPETSAVAVRADPAFAASAGDLVQVWTSDPAERVLTAELRGKVGDVVTLAVDAADTRKLDAEQTYRLVTLPVETRPDREFASLLRAADETMAAVTVADGSALAGQPLGALDVSVVAVRPADGPVEPLPARDRRLVAGDALYLIATPEAIRKVETAARADAADGAADAGAAMPADRRVDARTPVATAEGDTGPDASAAAVDALDDEETPGIQALERDDAGTDTEAETGDGTEPDDASPAAVDEDAAPDDATPADASEDASGGDASDPLELGDPDLSPLGEAGEATDGDEATDDDPTGGEPASTMDGEGDPDATGDADGEERAPASWTDLTTDGPAADAPQTDPTTPDEEGDPDGTDDDATDADPAGGDATEADDGGPDSEDQSETDGDGDGGDENEGDGEREGGREAGAGDDGEGGGESEPGDDGDESGATAESAEDDPSTDDLADLPGADPAEFTGTDVESLDDLAEDEDDERD